ncbi:MAG: hypothetical protein ACRDR6_15315 [Pseudonocardiaceae bacterium]
MAQDRAPIARWGLKGLWRNTKPLLRRFDFDHRIRAVLTTVPAAWAPVLDAAGDSRADAQVAELTGLLRHSHSGDRLTGRHAGRSP